MAERIWLAKIAKLCNLRCAYCYEWNELGLRDRMPLPTWRRVFEAVRDAARIDEARTGEPSRATIVLHGGEPLIVPVDELERVLSLAREVLGDGDWWQVQAQSNLFHLSDDVIDLLVRHRVGVGVSLDVVPGVRLTINGRQTEAAVDRNIERLRARGVPVAAIAVLAGHTAPRITDVYDHFAARGLPLRVLSLFDGPAERDTSSFAVAPEAIDAAFERLFVHWLATGAAIPVKPFDAWLAIVVRKVLGIADPMFDRVGDGEEHLIVDPKGDVYQVHDAYVPELRLGNLATDDIATILASDAYARSLVRDRATIAATCTGCAHAGACRGAEAIVVGPSQRARGRCGTVHNLLAFVEHQVRAAGFGAGELQALLDQVRGDGGATAPLAAVA